jgi:hypothetical protein
MKRYVSFVMTNLKIEHIYNSSLHLIQNCFSLTPSVADPGCLSRIPDVYPGSGFFRITDPGSQKTWGGEINFSYFCFLTFL